MVPAPRSRSRGLPPAAVAVLVAGVLLLSFPGTISGGGRGSSDRVAAEWLHPEATLNASCPQGTGRTVTGFGEDSILPTAAIWIGTYPYDAVVYSPQGLGTAFSNLEAKTAAFAAGLAQPTYAQRLALPGILQMPVGATAIAIVVNLPGVSAPINLTGTVLSKIYLGSITQWDDPAIAALNPGTALPSATIVVVHRADADGSTLLFTQFLSRSDPTWAASVGNGSTVAWPLGVGIRGADGVLLDVQQTSDAIGYVPYPTAEANAGVVAAVVGPAGAPVLPTAASTAAAVAANPGPLPAGSGNWTNVTLIDEPGAGVYPIVGFDYLYFLQDQSASTSAQRTPAAAEALWNLLSWVAGRTGAAETAIGAGALPSSVLDQDAATLGSMTWNGSSLSAIAPECAVTFTASGLPPGTSWGVTVGSTLNQSMGTQVGFFLENGSTVPFTVLIPADYFANPASGNVSPTGAVTTETILFGSATAAAPSVASFVASPSPVVVDHPVHLAVSVSGGAAPLSFAYAGLPAGCASANASQLNCTPSETGTFNVSVWVNDTAHRSSRGFVDLSVITQPPNSGPIFGSSFPWGYVILGAVAAGVVFLGFGYWHRRRRGRRANPEPAPSR